MEETARARHAIADDPRRRLVICGRFSKQFVSLRDADRKAISAARAQFQDAIASVEMIDSWHKDVIDDIFSSELVFSMTNNIAFYVSNKLLPFAVPLVPAPVRRDRTSVQQVRDYISSFSTSSNLLQHVYVTELCQLHEAQLLKVRTMFVLDDGRPVQQLSLEELLQGWEARASNGEATLGLSDVVVRIIDESFTELFYVLRGDCIRFSVSASENHSCSITTLDGAAPDYIRAMQKKADRLDSDGRIRPSWTEYVAIICSVLMSLGVAVTALLFNWSGRDNWLERVFDGVGVFSLSSAVTVALASRRVDVYDLIFLMFGRARFLTGCLEMLSVLGVSDRELKVALTYPGVVIAPLAGSSTCYAHEGHDGMFDTLTGFSSEEEKGNVIIGSMAAVARTREGGVLHYRVTSRLLTHHMGLADDALFRIVVPGDEVFVKG